jgi:hypothetical protein
MYAVNDNAYEWGADNHYTYWLAGERQCGKGQKECRRQLVIYGLPCRHHKRVIVYIAIICYITACSTVDSMTLTMALIQT